MYSLSTEKVSLSLSFFTSFSSFTLKSYFSNYRSRMSLLNFWGFGFFDTRSMVTSSQPIWGRDFSLTATSKTFPVLKKTSMHYFSSSSLKLGLKVSWIFSSSVCCCCALVTVSSLLFFHVRTLFEFPQNFLFLPFSHLNKMLIKSLSSNFGTDGLFERQISGSSSGSSTTRTSNTNPQRAP